MPLTRRRQGQREQLGEPVRDSSSLRLPRDPLHDIGGPITRLRAKRMHQALNQLILDIHTTEGLKFKDAELEDHFVHVLSFEDHGPDDFKG